LKKSWIVLAVVAIVALSGPTVFMFVMQRSLNTPYPFETVQTGSMVPTLNVGDLIVVQGIPFSEVKNSDIIVFHSPYDYTTLIVHRVVAIQTAQAQVYFSTKGDANGGPDPWQVLGSDFVGKVVSVYPGVGWFFIGLDYIRPVLWVALIIIAIVTLLLFIRDNKKSQKAEAPKPVSEGI
jgi:signal peptidase